MPGSKAEEREGIYGKRMIELRVRFWTNNIADGEGQIVPKHAWAKGVVRMEANDSHGIESGRTIPFQSLLDLSSVIERTLIDHGIKLHVPRKMLKYIVVADD